MQRTPGLPNGKIWAFPYGLSFTFYHFGKRLNTCFKKVPFLAKAWHWCLHLHLDCSKFDLSSWVIPSIPLVKFKGCSFQFWRSRRSQTKHSGDIAIFFTVIFIILMEWKCILKKWYSFTYCSNWKNYECEFL